MNTLSDLAVVIPVVERHDDLRDLWAAYDDSIQSFADRITYVIVIDDGFPEAAAQAAEIAKQDNRVQVIQLNRGFGESTALTVAKDYVTSAFVLTLPAYHQVNPVDLPILTDELSESDIVIAVRRRRNDSKINRLSSLLFNRLVRSVTGLYFHDLGCSVRLMRREALSEIQIYGDQHRFLPILAHQKGFHVREVCLRQAEQDKKLRIYRPGVYLRRGLDILAVFFLAKFTKKPLRFFGLIGAGLMSVGALVLIVTALQRILLSIGLADRPLLLLGLLSIVLGVQLFAVGLLGELIIFVHASELKEYAVAETINVDKRQSQSGRQEDEGIAQKP